MLNVAWVTPYIITGGIMWFIVYQMAPIGREFSLGRTILGVVWMALCERGANALLHPYIEYWSILAGFLVSVLVVMLWFDLKFWRSLFAVFLYNTSLIGSFLLREYGAKYLPPPDKSAATTRSAVGETISSKRSLIPPAGQICVIRRFPRQVQSPS